MTGYDKGILRLFWRKNLSIILKFYMYFIITSQQRMGCTSHGCVLWFRMITRNWIFPEKEQEGHDCWYSLSSGITPSKVSRKASVRGWRTEALSWSFSLFVLIVIIFLLKHEPVKSAGLFWDRFSISSSGLSSLQVSPAAQVLAERMLNGYLHPTMLKPNSIKLVFNLAVNADVSAAAA